MSVKGKTILVTGASQGIGRGIALRLARDGANIALVDIKADKLDSVRKEVEALGVRATTFRADVSKRDEVYAAIDHAEKELGGFDAIVNNAGIAQVKPLADVGPEDLERIFRINVDGVVWGIQAAAKKFQARGHKGKIINAS
jgi:meso-butanediol dehydrogenase/(S,S)-butanediol dehydrogenase/diacetyl reductase